MNITFTASHMIGTKYRRVEGKSYCQWWYVISDDRDDTLIEEKGPYASQREAFEAGDRASIRIANLNTLRLQQQGIIQ